MDLIWKKTSARSYLYNKKKMVCEFIREEGRGKSNSELDTGVLFLHQKNLVSIVVGWLVKKMSYIFVT